MLLSLLCLRHKYRLIALVRRHLLKESSFDLISVNRPFGIRVLFAAVEFEIRSGADLLNQASKEKWLAAMDCATHGLLTAYRSDLERQISAHAK